MLLERNQRRLCRLLFVVGCVLPTLAVGAWAVDRLRPAFGERLLAEASRLFDGVIACDSLTTPRPGVYEMRRVRWEDPGEGRLLAECDTLRVARHGAGWRFAVNQLRLSEQAIDAERWAGWVGVDAEGTCRSATLFGTGLADKMRLEDLAVRVTRDGEATTSSLTITHAGGAKLVELSRNAAERGFVDRVSIDTTKAPLPAVWLPCPALASIDAGHGLRFRGVAQATWASADAPVVGEAIGRFEADDLDERGVRCRSAVAQVEELRWRGERIERVAGRFEARDGRLSRELAFGVNAWLEADAFPAMIRLYGDASDDAAGGTVPFTQLACQVELDEEGLVLIAGCGEIDGVQRGGAVAHALLEHEGEALLREPRTRPLPTWRLVRALYSSGKAELPTTPAAVELARRLPAPDQTVR